jgi:hypothetical protein
MTYLQNICVSPNVLIGNAYVVEDKTFKKYQRNVAEYNIHNEVCRLLGCDAVWFL